MIGVHAIRSPNDRRPLSRQIPGQADTRLQVHSVVVHLVNVSAHAKKGDGRRVEHDEAIIPFGWRHRPVRSDAEFQRQVRSKPQLILPEQPDGVLRHVCALVAERDAEGVGGPCDEVGHGREVEPPGIPCVPLAVVPPVVAAHSQRVPVPLITDRVGGHDRRALAACQRVRWSPEVQSPSDTDLRQSNRAVATDTNAEVGWIEQLRRRGDAHAAEKAQASLVDQRGTQNAQVIQGQHLSVALADIAEPRNRVSLQERFCPIIPHVCVVALRTPIDGWRDCEVHGPGVRFEWCCCGTDKSGSPARVNTIRHRDEP